MASWSLTARVTLFVFCLLLLPSVGCAISVPQTSEAYPGQILSDPTPLYVWNVPLNAVILGLLSITVPTALFILIQILFSLPMRLQLGHKRVSCQNILDNENRNAVYMCIQENPGIHISNLLQMLEMNIGTLRYHVGVLCRMGKVVAEQNCTGISYYVSGDPFPELEKTITGYSYEFPKGRIISLVLQHPGIARKDIASRLIMSGPNVTWHMRSLTREGIVRSERDGRHVRYYLCQDVKEHIMAQKSWHLASAGREVSGTGT